MAKRKHESSAKYLSRMLSRLKDEDDYYLQFFTTVQSLIDYFELWEFYDTTLMFGIVESIEVFKDDPKHYNDFIEKYNMPWNKFINGKFEEKH